MKDPLTIGYELMWLLVPDPTVPLRCDANGICLLAWDIP